MTGFGYIGISVTGGVVNDGLLPSDDLDQVKAQFDPSEFDPEDDDLLVLDCLTGKIASRWDFEKERWS